MFGKLVAEFLSLHGMTDASRVTEGAQEAADRTMDALAHTLVAATPWLLDLGSWVFAALIAFALLILAALLTVGPVDLAVLIGTAALALGLPLEVGEFVLLRVIKDFQSNKLEEVAEQVLHDAGIDIPGSASNPQPATARVQRRTILSLAVAYAMLVLAIMNSKRFGGS